MRMSPPCINAGCHAKRHRFRFGLVPGRMETVDRCEEHWFEDYLNGLAEPFVRSRRKSSSKREYSPKWRKAILRRDGYTCQDCGSTENLHAHHIERVLHAPEKQHDIGNGITVCVYCHAERHEADGLDALILSAVA